MKFGSFLFSFLSIIFLFYTNSFLMKRRKIELGLYNILGMEKKHIAKILYWENLICLLVSLAVGLTVGVVFNRYTTTLLSGIMSVDLPFSTSFSILALLKTVGLFVLIFIALYGYNTRQVHLANPIQLLQGGKTGEKEPKTNWIVAVLGIVSLAIGYYLAVTVKEPMKDATLLFAAVVLVAVGTYALFFAISIMVLKALKKNIDFYFKPENFTVISGMLYRMKQNAVGLANICILSTATLIVLATTSSLYIGIGSILDRSFTKDFSVTISASDKEAIQKIHSILDEKEEEYALSFENTVEYTGGRFGNDLTQDGKLDFFFFMPMDDYNRLTGKSVTLAEDEILVFSEKVNIKTDTIPFGKVIIKIKEKLSSFPVENDNSDNYGTNWTYIVAAHDGDLAKCYGINDKTLENLNYFYEFDLSGKNESKTDFAYTVKDKIEELPQATVDCKYITRDSMIVRFGGVLFLGIILSIILFMETALSIYYKQISEGYDDKERFRILRKIGMSKKEVRHTIKRQIFIVFFSPLIVALIHITAAFPMITRLLAVANMRNIALFAGCSAVCVLTFTIIYAIVFMLTARAYDKIVS